MICKTKKKQPKKDYFIHFSRKFDAKNKFSIFLLIFAHNKIKQQEKGRKKKNGKKRKIEKKEQKKIDEKKIDKKINKKNDKKINKKK